MARSCLNAGGWASSFGATGCIFDCQDVFVGDTAANNSSLAGG
jgi:hypothetical protein